MLSCYCTNNVAFTARSEAHITTTENWVEAQVSINKAMGDTRWLLVQEKSEGGVKILYSAVISKDVKLAFEEDNQTVVLRRPRTTPQDLSEYKLKFESRFDFWACLFALTTARGRTSKQNGDAMQRSVPVLMDALAGAAPTGPTMMGQQGSGAGQDDLGGMGQLFQHDLYNLLGGQ